MNSTVAEKAKAIKQELKVKYPGHKFSVTSENYSMGSSFYVSWIDGVTVAEVEAITNKYKDVRRCEYSGDILSGGNCFSHIKRSYSPEVFQPEVERISKQYKITDWRGERVEMMQTRINSDGAMELTDCYGIDGDRCNPVYSLFAETIGSTSYYKPVAGKSPAIGDSITVTENDEKNGVGIKFDSKPSREILDDLKANGFKYSRKQNIWYAKRNEKNLNFAALIANRTPAPREEEPETNDFSYLFNAHRKPAPAPAPAPAAATEQPRPLLALAPAAAPVTTFTPRPVVAEIVDDPNLSVADFRAAATSGKAISLYAFSQAINRENTPPAPAPAAVAVVQTPKPVAASTPTEPAIKSLMVGDRLPGGWVCVRSSRGID